jgi:hypothetical protein
MAARAYLLHPVHQAQMPLPSGLSTKGSLKTQDVSTKRRQPRPSRLSLAGPRAHQRRAKHLLGSTDVVPGVAIRPADGASRANQRVMPLNGGEQFEAVRADGKASVDLQPGFRAHLDVEDARTCMLIACGASD